MKNENTNSINEIYMRRAIELAKKAQGFTNPNPMVGAVIVKDGRIIGEGYHKICGELHAERNAFAALTESAKGATIYVTLEPCCHYGKTPPCTEAIIENELARVVIGSRDPNPLVSGKGASILREHGIEVVEDFLKEECDEINPVFFHYITNKRPYVVMKYGMTADGKIATKIGKSQWITNEKSRHQVQLMRHKYMGIMVGIGTVLADNPMLNVRVDGLKSPIRIICDSKMRIPTDCKLVETAKEYKTIVVCADSYKEINEEKRHLLEQKGVVVEYIESDNNRINLESLMKRLGEIGIDSVFVEGGATLNDSLRKNGLVNQLEVFVAPKMFGGVDAKSAVGGDGIDEVDDALTFNLKEIKQFDQDVLLTYVRMYDY